MDLEVEAVAISKDGTRIAAISIAPERRLIVWNVETKEVMFKHNLKLNFFPKTERKSWLSFHPKNASIIAVSGKSSLCVCRIDAHPDGPVM